MLVGVGQGERVRVERLDLDAVAAHHAVLADLARDDSVGPAQADRSQ